jgi:iron complex outermembrane recepter protein
MTKKSLEFDTLSKFLTVAGCAAVVLVLAPARSMAALQEGSTNQDAAALEEVTVTARRREERLQSTPVSVTAFTAEDIEQRGLTNLAEVGNNVPNVTSTISLGGGGSHGQYFIRGLGQFDFIVTSEQSVGFYLDGVYIGRSTGAALDVVDIERVEVLRGPQGTLFGRNTTAGAINVITAKPTDEFTVDAEATFGSRNRMDAKLDLNTPLIGGKLANKFAVASLNQDGWGTRLLDGSESGNRNRWVARDQLLWTPQNGVSVLLAGDVTRTREQGYVEHLVNVNPEFFAFYNDFFLTPQGLPPVDRRFITGPDSTFANEANKNENDIWGISANVDWQLAESLVFRSISSYRQLESESGYDLDGTPYPIIEQEINVDHTQWSQEFQLSGTSLERLNWIVGAFYYHEEADDLEDIPFLQAIEGIGQRRVEEGFMEYVVTGPPLFIFAGPETDSYAAFAQGTWALTDALSTTVGLRYTYEEKENFNFMSGVLTRDPNTLSDNWSDVSPRIGFEYQANPDLLLYFSAAKGFRSGVFNGRALSAVVPPAADPEEVWAYELGTKSEWLDRRLRLNGAAFYYDYKDLQGNTLEQSATILGNIASVELYGFELEMLARPVDPLMISLGVGYTGQNIKDVDPGAVLANTIRSDTKIPGAPEWTALASLQYDMFSGNGGSLALRLDTSYKSAYEFLLPNFPDEGENGYYLLDARLIYGARDGRWQAHLFGRNLTDQRYRVQAQNGQGFGIGYTTAAFNPPREWGITVRFRLD